MPLTNRTPHASAIFGDLLGPSGQYREALVTDGVLSTYTVPGDQPNDSRGWFLDSTSPVAAEEGHTHPSATFDDLELLIDGVETFAAMIEALDTAGSGDLILLLGWVLDFECRPLAAASGRGPHVDAYLNQTWHQIFEARVNAGAQLRVVLWEQSTYVNNDFPRWVRDAKRFIDAFPGSGETPPRARCILDNSAGLTGSHHQKILVIVRPGEIVGFVGGVDLNHDRLGNWHDVHCRVRGEAARQLLETAVLRWNNATFPVQGPAPGLSVAPIRPGRGIQVDDLTRVVPGPMGAQRHRFRGEVVQTIGNPDIRSLAGQVEDILPLLRRGIASARRYIYIEDQYFWYEPLARDLAAALRHIESLIILLPEHCVDGGLNLRYWGIRTLHDAAFNFGMLHKVGIYVKAEYVHAKTWMFDDELAVVGSANINRRGMESDSECSIGIADARRGHAWHTLHANAARILRTRLWNHHLNLPFGELADPVAATAFWRRSSSLAAPISVCPINRVDWDRADYSRVAEPHGWSQQGVVDDVTDPAD